MKRGACLAALALATLRAYAVELPPTCFESPPVVDPARSIEDLRSEVVRINETDPHRAVQILCGTIPRVERERGADSLELAWWVGSLATPLIAYHDRHAEALPLLDFAEPIFARELGPYAAEVADIHVAHAWIDFRKGNLEAAGEAWERALSAREHNPGEKQIELQKALVGLAQVRLSQRDFAAARVALERAQAILVANGETVSEAAAAIASAFAALALREEDYRAARRHSEQLLSIEHAMASPAAQLVAGYAMLGQILERLDEFEAAEAALREGIRLAEGGEDAPLQRHLLAALTQLAAVLVERGRATAAQPFAERAVGVAEATLGTDAPRLVRVLDVRAETHRALGDLPLALRDFERASAIVEAKPDDVEKPTRVAHFRDLGVLYANLGDDAAARAAFARALEVAADDATLETQRADVLLTQGGMALGQTTARRRAHLESGIELLRRKLPDSHPAILRAVNEICGLELREAMAASSHCDDAARRLDAAKDFEPALASEVLANQSQRAEQTGDADAAYRLAIESLAAAEALGTPDPRWRAYFRLARLIDQRGDVALATFFGKKSIADIERLRRYFVDDDRRFDRTFLADKVGVYRTVADWLMASGRIDEGLDVLRLLKSEELHDFVMRDALTAGVDERVSWTAVEEDLDRRYRDRLGADAVNGAEMERLGQLEREGLISVIEAKSLDGLLAGQRASVRRRAEQLRAWLDDAASAAADAVAPASVDTTRIVRSDTIERERARFGEQVVLAVFLLTDTHLRTLIATRDGVTAIEKTIDVSTLRRRIGALLDAITRRAPIDAPQRELYELLVEPIDLAARAAGADRVVLWLDGVLRYVPFAALGDGSGYFGDRVALQVYSPLRAAMAEDRTGRLSIRGLGVTRAVAGQSALPAVAEELCSIIRGPIDGLESSPPDCVDGRVGTGAIDGAGYVDAAFTKARLDALLAGRDDFSVLHLGTHFSLRPGNALRSSLLLGDGTRLTLDALSAFDFTRLNLVTLSACQTGLGGATGDDGREVEGLSALVQRRGARRVVASLWRVEDASTAALMRELYASIAAGSSAATALQHAARALRADARFRHPYYWAGFVVAGAAP